MPKKANNLDSEPAVKAAKITSSRALISTIVAACITAIATISVAVTNNCGSKPIPSPSPVSSPGSKGFTGRVINKVTEAKVRGAKVSLEGDGIPAVAFTDSEGIFSFPLDDTTKEIRLRIDAEGYEKFDLKVTPAKNQGIQEVRLTSVQLIQALPSPSQSSHRIPSEKKLREETLSRVHGRVIDVETEGPIAGVRVAVVGYGKEAIMTGADGEFDLASHKIGDQTFRLRAEKDGYSIKEQWHQAGSQLATIRLHRK